MPTPDATLTYRSLGSLDEVDRLSLPGLSEWFDAFLPLFMKDALRTGGTVEVAQIDDEVAGAYLYSATEEVGSVFTRVRAVAEHYLAHLGRGGTYADQPWRPCGEPIEILAADLRDWEPAIALRNPVRIGQPDDLPRIRAFMRQVAGPVDDAWFRTLPRSEETCFLCEVGGRVVGVSWASRIGPYARGHSFVVHPRYRGLGVGTDLLRARMTWFQNVGVRQVVSEIYDDNRASRTAAERAGMAVVGRMFHFHATPPESPAPALRS